MGTPDCSVVIPVYNTPAPWIEECTESIFSQEGTTFEIVIVDDGSTNDETLRALEVLTHRPEVRVLFTPRGGTALAVQAGVEAALSEIIIRIDSDDIMSPFRLRDQVNWLHRHKSYDLVCGALCTIDEFGNAIGECILPVGEILEPYWEVDWRICTPTVAVRRQTVLDAGPCSPVIPDDYDLWCRLSWIGARMYCTDIFWGKYRVHPGMNTKEQGWKKWYQAVKRYYQTRAKDENWVRPVYQ